MSSDFVTKLFPSATAFVQKHIPALWDQIFPASSAQQCPSDMLSVKVPFLPKENLPEYHAFLGYPASPSDYFPVRSPLLVAVEVPGILIGLLGFLLIERKYWAWRTSFLLFAFMNASAIFCHNLMKPGTDEMWWAWALDVAFTGASSYCLILASLFQRFPYVSKPGVRVASVDMEPGLAQFSFVIGLTACLTGSILGIANPPTRFVPWTSEIIYVALTVLAGLCLAFRVVLPVLFSSTVAKGALRVTGFGKLWLLLATVSILFGAGGLVVDRYLCDFMVANKYVLDFNLAHILFLGCDLSFLFLLGYVLSGLVPTAAAIKKKTK
ncbi:hypothetical protein HDU96_002662 [Phlyctochytrium bullatum]|nr:hypothetical protein HDU96_002662 [Phlyctochytrium bullatum]